MWNSGLINKNNAKQGFCYGTGSLELRRCNFPSLYKVTKRVDNNIIFSCDLIRQKNHSAGTIYSMS